MVPALYWEAKREPVDSKLLSSRARRSLAFGLEKADSIASSCANGGPWLEPGTVVTSRSGDIGWSQVLEPRRDRP